MDIVLGIIDNHFNNLKTEKKPFQSSAILWSYGWTSKILKFYNVSGNSHCLLYLQNTWTQNAHLHTQETHI